MKARKIVITGGPGTGKTSIIESLEKRGYSCFHEISREIIRKAQKEGINQLFLKDPLLFSEMLLEGRIAQHQDAQKMDTSWVFLDRGVPDVVAYMNFFGNEYPPVFNRVCQQYTYDQVFILPPWKQIYTDDNERYESYGQAVSIHQHLLKSYTAHGYEPVEVPQRPVEERISFMLEHLE